ncbi:MAG: YqaJ viral recombinase family nuclease [Armatimonadota bacterium]
MSELPSILNRIDEIALRRKGIGGGDVGPILGVHPWKTAHDVWLEKMGLAEREETEAMVWGNLLEPIIAGEYAKRQGVQLSQPKNRFVRHPERRWMLGHLDYLGVDAPGGVDAKSTNPRQAWRWGPQGTDEMPEENLLQMAWYLGIMAPQGYEWWDVAALIGNEMRIYRVQRHIELETILVERCHEWYERYLVTATPPPVDHSRASRDMLQKIFPRLSGQIRTATPAETETVLVFQAARDRVIQEREEIDLFENRICALIGEDDGVEGPWGRITWKRTKDSQRVDWEAVAKALWNEVALRSGHPNPLLSLTLTKDTFGEIVQRHSTPVHGTRRFYPRFTREGEER